MTENFKSPKYPQKALIAAVAAFFALILSNFYFQSHTKQLFQAATDKTQELELLKNEIRNQHQVMDLATRMSAYSGYVSWETTYYHTHKAYRETLGSIYALLPNFPRIDQSESEIELRAIDEKIFALVRESKMSAAKAEVQGMRRERLGVKQGELLRQGDNVIAEFVASQAKEIQRRSLISDWMNIGMILILSALTASILKLFSAWASRMREANRGLDALVQEKVRELDTERMKLMESSKMASLGEMAGGIAHEINNPLAIIQMRADQMNELTQSQPLDPAMLVECAGVIRKTTTRIAKIVKGLRSFARDGKNDPFQSVELKTVLEETLDLCREKFKNNNVALDVIMPAAPLRVDCRATQLSQVILNLVGNAFDAIQGREEKWVKITVRDLDPSVEIGIMDSGEGIPAQVQEKMMLPFFTTKEVGKGTGLGLSISKSIVQMHQGQLSVDNTAKNTHFVIVLPKRQSRAQAA